MQQPVDGAIKTLLNSKLIEIEKYMNADVLSYF